MSEAAKKDRIMEMVRKELDKDPGVENRTLYEKATEIDESVEDLTLRQFHARYPLQVKRKMAQDGGGGRGKKKKKTSSKGSKTTSRGRKSAPKKATDLDRDGIRRTLLRFARDVSAADGKAEMIDLLSNMDGYVDDVLEAADTG